MAVIQNLTGHTIRFEAFNANKKLMDQNAPAIPSGFARYVNQDHIGSSEYFFCLAFFQTEEFTPPPGMGIIQGQSGGGGGVTIAGFGGSASATVTTAFSQPVAACKVLRHAGWNLTQPAGPGGDLVFAPGSSATGDQLMGW